MDQAKTMFIDVLKHVSALEGDKTAPTFFSQLYKKYEISTWKTNLGEKRVRQCLMQELHNNEALNRHFTLNELVHLHFLMSIPVSAKFEEAMSISGLFELDNLRRINEYESNDGLFKRARKHQTRTNSKSHPKESQHTIRKEEKSALEPAQKQIKTEADATPRPAFAPIAVDTTGTSGSSSNPRLAVKNKTPVDCQGYRQALLNEVKRETDEQINQLAADVRVKTERGATTEPETAVNATGTARTAHNEPENVKVEGPIDDQAHQSNIHNEVKTEPAEQNIHVAEEVKPQAAILNDHILSSLKNLILAIDSSHLDTLQSKILLAESRRNSALIPEEELVNSIKYSFDTIFRGASKSKPSDEAMQLEHFSKMLVLTLLHLGFDKNSRLIHDITEKAKGDTWILMEKATWMVECLFYTATAVSDN